MTDTWLEKALESAESAPAGEAFRPLSEEEEDWIDRLVESWESDWRDRR